MTSENTDIVKCTNAPGQYILKARQNLFEKTRSQNTAVRQLAWEAIKELYNDNLYSLPNPLQ